MWNAILKYVAKGLVWAVNNPDDAKKLVDEAVTVAKAVKASKKG